MRPHLLALFALGILAGIGGCKDTAVPPDTLPYVLVNEQIYLSTVEGQKLNARDGAWIYHPGGLGGLIVYRRAQNAFLCFERKNPNPVGCRVSVDPTAFYMVDSCNQSQHYFDGTIRGTDTRQLRQYTVNNDGIRLIITN